MFSSPTFKLFVVAALVIIAAVAYLTYQKQNFLPTSSTTSGVSVAVNNPTATPIATSTSTPTPTPVPVTGKPDDVTATVLQENTDVVSPEETDQSFLNASSDNLSSLDTPNVSQNEL